MSDYVYPELARHLRERLEVKALGYGTPLKTNNGRNSLVDTYQELLDAIPYMDQYCIDSAANVDLKVADNYWVKDEPSPVDNGGEIVIYDVMYDLKDIELFTANDLHPDDVLYRDIIRLAERVRLRIEHDKTKIQSEGGL